MLAIVLCAVFAVAIVAPETPLGRAFREFLIDTPARRLNSLRCSHLVALLVAVGVFVALFVYAKTDGVTLFAQGLPEALSWFVTFDIATYIDAMALLALFAASVRLRAAYLALRSAPLLVRRWVLTLLPGLRFRQACRASRRRRAAPTAPGGSKEEDGSWRLPAAAFA